MFLKPVPKRTPFRNPCYTDWMVNAPGEVQQKCFDVSGIYSFKRELKTAFYVRSHQQKLILLQLGVVKCKFPFFLSFRGVADSFIPYLAAVNPF
jgi:hypothetical protein